MCCRTLHDHATRATPHAPPTRARSLHKLLPAIHPCTTPMHALPLAACAPQSILAPYSRTYTVDAYIQYQALAALSPMTIGCGAMVPVGLLVPVPRAKETTM